MNISERLKSLRVYTAKDLGAESFAPIAGTTIRPTTVILVSSQTRDEILELLEISEIIVCLYTASVKQTKK